MIAQRLHTAPRILATAGFAILVGACGESAPPSFEVHPGVEFVTVTGAEPGVPLTLYSPADVPMLTLLADAAGNAHFAYIPDEHVVLESTAGTRFPIVDGRTLKGGDGYVIRNDEADPVQRSAPFSVLRVSSVPDVALYERQTLTGIPTSVLGLDREIDIYEGFQYIEMRDGVKLGVMIRFPDASLYGAAPWPTVIEYSGYSPSKPEGSEPGSRIANLLGYVTVGVNMRGTGCSGGVFDVFNPAQHADGYDVIETVARQSWVEHGKVGMIGLSYAGISQLFVASTRPPSLAAITPQSVIADPWQMQWPGGIYNSGFTRQWIDNRDAQAAANGMNWTSRRVEAGDETCRTNLKLRSQNIDFESFLHGLEFRPRDADDRSLPRLVQNIDVPVYLTGAFQDEQTGADFAGMLGAFTGTDVKKFTMYNGRHPDGYSPLVVSRWAEFLDFYVARRTPKIDGLVRFGAESEFADQFDAPGIGGFEPDRFAGMDYESALAQYEAERLVRVIFENGAGHEVAGAPRGRYETNFAAWPPEDTTPRTFYLGPDGRLGDAAPLVAGADSYQHDPAAGGSTFFGPKGYQLLVALWDVDWTEFEVGRLLSYVTEPFDETTIVAGMGRAELWIASPVEDVHVQVTISEVRADGNETLVQSGWLRLGHRNLSRTYDRAEFEPMPTGVLVPVEIQLPSVAHAFRAGSRLRVTISTPGRNHGTWEFEAPDYGPESPSFVISRGPQTPSSLVLPILNRPQLQVPVEAPPCPSLRGQPCRTYRPAANSPG